MSPMSLSFSNGLHSKNGKAAKVVNVNWCKLASKYDHIVQISTRVQLTSVFYLMVLKTLFTCPPLYCLHSEKHKSWRHTDTLRWYFIRLYLPFGEKKESIIIYLWQDAFIMSTSRKEKPILLMLSDILLGSWAHELYQMFSFLSSILSLGVSFDLNTTEWRTAGTLLAANKAEGKNTPNRYTIQIMGN